MVSGRTKSTRVAVVSAPQDVDTSEDEEDTGDQEDIDDSEILADLPSETEVKLQLCDP